MNKHLHQQVERIADESRETKVSVIVQMTTDDKEMETVLETGTEAIRRRRVTVAARDLLPAPAETLKRASGKKPTAATKRKLLTTSGQSFASSLARTNLSRAVESTISKVGLKALAPLFSSQWIAELVGKAREGQSQRAAQKKTATEIPHFWSSGSAVLEVPRDDLTTLVDQVPGIADIYPNRRVNVPPVVDVKKLPAGVSAMESHISTWGLQKTAALAAWGAFGKRGEGTKVAILDTGVDADHPELKGKIAGFAEFDHNGRKLGAAKPYDSDQHGTHCAGTVAGGNAGGHWIGMAPDAKILAGLVLKNGSGTDAQILAGMQWAVEQGADVISMSLGGLRMSADVLDTYTRTIINAARLGIPVVVAIGNEGHQTSGSPGNDFFAFAVGATDADDRAAGFSGGRTQIVEQSRFINPRHLPLVYGKPDVSAPGVAVYSCIPNGKYASWNGTSMATPHVAGAIALLLSATTIGEVEPAERAFLVQDLLTATVEEIGESGQDHRFGFGRIDVLRAIGHALELGYGKK